MKHNPVCVPVVIVLIFKIRKTYSVRLYNHIYSLSEYSRRIEHLLAHIYIMNSWSIYETIYKQYRPGRTLNASSAGGNV